MSEPGRILVVDDETQITRVLRRSLAARGYEVQVAGEGEEALQIFGTWAPDLLITDLSMPRMAGSSSAAASAPSRASRSSSSRSRARTHEVEALDAGADDYVTKPFGIDELWRASAPRCAARRTRPGRRRRSRRATSASTSRPGR